MAPAGLDEVKDNEVACVKDKNTSNLPEVRNEPSHGQRDLQPTSKQASSFRNKRSGARLEGRSKKPSTTDSVNIVAEPHTVEVCVASEPSPGASKDTPDLPPPRTKPPTRANASVNPLEARPVQTREQICRHGGLASKPRKAR